MLHEINSDLKVAEATLRHWEKRYPQIARVAAKARIRYDIAWANAVDEIANGAIEKGEKPPTLPVQDAKATKRVAAQLAKARLAESQLDVAKKLIGIAETTLTSIQTRVKIEQMEMSLS